MNHGSNYNKIFGILILLQGITSQPFLFSQIPVSGHVTDTVRCSAITGQSYALFLPENYGSKKSWPVILIFDPAARGRTGVNTFIEAGNKYGFILACSNNSRNGPMENNFIAADAMLKDIEEKYSIDQHRIYTAGFSGGSRFALTFAVKEKRISGVIGCGAGLSDHKDYLPSVKSDFCYYGLAGNRDMNFPEMQELPGFFDKRTSVTSYFRAFSGGHEWPGPDLISEAMEWLLLQSMNRKMIPADQTFVSYIENKTEDLIDSQLTTGNLADGAMYTRFAVRDFNGTPFASRMSELLNNTEKSNQYKAAIRRLNKIIETEKAKKNECLDHLTEIFQSGSLTDSNLVWWKNETRSLVKLRDKGKPENSQQASRILNFISIVCYEQGASFYRNKFYLKAASMFQICTYSDSENPNCYYNFSRSLAGSGKSRESITALSEAIEHGFNSRKMVESDPVFMPVRSDIRYKELVNKMD